MLPLQISNIYLIVFLLEINFSNSTNLQTVITLSIQLKIKQNYHRTNAISMVFRQCVDEEDHIKTNLCIYKSRSLSRNQVQKLNLPSNAHNFANTTRTWTKVLPKELKF